MATLLLQEELAILLPQAHIPHLPVELVTLLLGATLLPQVQDILEQQEDILLLQEEQGTLLLVVGILVLQELVATLLLLADRLVVVDLALLVSDWMEKNVGKEDCD